MCIRLCITVINFMHFSYLLFCSVFQISPNIRNSKNKPRNLNKVEKGVAVGFNQEETWGRQSGKKR